MIPRDKLKLLIVEIFRLWRKKNDGNKSSKQYEPPLNKQKQSEPQQLSFDIPHMGPHIDVSKLKGQLPLNISPPKYLSQKELKQRMETPPFYTDPIKWRKDNFVGGDEYKKDKPWEEDPDNPLIYTGPDLNKFGFGFNSIYQRMIPMEKVKSPLLIVSDLEGNMRLWNRSLAAKIGLAPKPVYA
jgi:hypothetical protein